VLCLDAVGGRIIAVECKDFQMARVPNEVRADLEELFISTDRSRCSQEKHLRRIAWLSEHQAEVVPWMGGPAGCNWQVAGAFVFSLTLISPVLGHARLPVVSFRDLRNGAAI